MSTAQTASTGATDLARTQRPRPRALLAMHARLAPNLFDPGTLDRLTSLAELDPTLVLDEFGSPEALAALADTEIIVSSWGCPPIDAAVLAAAPRLRAVLHAAGSVKHHITEACWERGIQVTSATWANALPVAEYTVAAILFANKQLLRLSAEYRKHRMPHDWQLHNTDVGNYRRRVGIVGASQVGRRVIELLRPYDVEVLLHDPYVDEHEAAALGVSAVSLNELCALSDTVSIHAPELPATRHLISRRMLALMPDGATLINTSRGSLIDQQALIAQLETGRLNAVLDVTTPEVLPADSPLYDLPNVLLTPHVAGSLGNELHRMAAAAADELDRYTTGLPFAHPVRPQDSHRSA